MKNTLYLLSCILFSCSSSNTIVLVKNSGEAQGTYYHIQYLSKSGVSYKNEIDSILLEVDSSLSVYKDYSLISRLNAGEDLKTDSLFNTVFHGAKEVFLATEGNFDCSISPLVKEWGFYKHQLGDSLVIDSLKFKALLGIVGFSKIALTQDSLVLPENMHLDFNAIAQGYTVDLLAGFLAKKGIENYLIEVGGELIAKGRNADGNIWKVGVDKPTETIDMQERFQFIINLENKALATSGNYRKFYEKGGVKYAHTINPFTGFPAQNKLLSVTVVHDDCMLADAYATAFMVMGVKKSKRFAAEHQELEIYLVYTTSEAEWKTFISPEFEKRIN